MKVTSATFNGLSFGAGQTIKIVEASGFDDLPPVRSGDIARSGDHGFFLATNYLGERVMTFSLRIPGQASMAALDTLVDSLRQATLVQATQELALVLNGNRLVNARPSRRSIPDPIEDWGAWTVAPVVEFTASDPRIYDNTQTTVNFTAGQTQNVTNSGTFPTRPVATISGAVTNPQILNLTTGAAIKFTLTMIAGDVLVVDFNAKTIRLNGVNKFSALTTDSAWFDLVAGTTSIQYNATGASTMALVYRNAWL